MPIFEFECPKCQRRIERIFSRVEQADDADVRCVSVICPGMRKAKMQRTITAANFELKGPGFYKNDYKGNR